MKCESTADAERAVTQERTGKRERADQSESTDGKERAVTKERTDRNERAQSEP